MKRAPETRESVAEIQRQVWIPSSSPKSFPQTVEVARLTAEARVLASETHDAKWARALENNTAWTKTSTLALYALLNEPHRRGSSLNVEFDPPVDERLVSCLTRYREASTGSEESALLLPEVILTTTSAYIDELKESDANSLFCLACIASLDFKSVERSTRNKRAGNLGKEVSGYLARALSVVPNQHIAREVLRILSKMVSDRILDDSKTIVQIASLTRWGATHRAQSALLEEALERTVLSDRTLFTSVLSRLQQDLPPRDVMQRASDVARSSEVRQELSMLINRVENASPISIDESGDFLPEWGSERATVEQLLTRAFKRCSRIRIIERLTGGFGGAIVYRVQVERAGTLAADHIAKIGPRHTVLTEWRNYDEFVREFIHHSAPQVREAEAYGTLAILIYTLVGGPELRDVQDFLGYYRTHSTLEVTDAARRLFETLHSVWWKSAVPHVSTWEHSLYPHLPPVRTVRASRDGAEQFAGEIIKIEKGLVRLNNSHRLITVEMRRDPENTNRIGQRVTLRGTTNSTRPFELRIALARFGISDTDADRLLTLYVSLLSKRCERLQAYIHGDLHPRNAMLSPRGGIWLIDFGATGPGYPALDAVRFECHLRTQLASNDPDSVKRCSEWEKALSDGERTFDARLPATIATVRNAILPYLRYRGEYEEALFLYSMGMMRYILRQTSSNGLEAVLPVMQNCAALLR